MYRHSSERALSSACSLADAHANLSASANPRGAENRTSESERDRKKRAAPSWSHVHRSGFRRQPSYPSARSSMSSTLPHYACQRLLRSLLPRHCAYTVAASCHRAERDREPAISRRPSPSELFRDVYHAEQRIPCVRPRCSNENEAEQSATPRENGEPDRRVLQPSEVLYSSFLLVFPRQPSPSTLPNVFSSLLARSPASIKIPREEPRLAHQPKSTRNPR